MSTSQPPRLIVALDFADAAPAERTVARLDPSICRLKVGNELFTSAGPGLVERFQARGFEVFLDLKYHDIPNTVAAACRAASSLGVWMVNVHALGGRRMLDAAREAVNGGPLLIAVTVLTSHDAAALEAIGLAGTPREAALRLAHTAAQAGLDGVVCSPEEAAAVGRIGEGGLLRVTPGIRPDGTALNDQRRIATPAAAVAAGADYLVVGRPVTRAEDPAAAATKIAAEIAAARRLGRGVNACGRCG